MSSSPWQYSGSTKVFGAQLNWSQVADRALESWALTLDVGSHQGAGAEVKRDAAVLYLEGLPREKAD